VCDFLSAAPAPFPFHTSPAQSKNRRIYWQLPLCLSKAIGPNRLATKKLLVPTLVLAVQFCRYQQGRSYFDVVESDFAAEAQI
jgi:hypothetical protein